MSAKNIFGLGVLLIGIGWLSFNAGTMFHARTKSGASGRLLPAPSLLRASTGLLPKLKVIPVVTAGSKDIRVNLPVLMYHYVRPAPDPRIDPIGFGLSVSPQNFSEQMAYLVKNGYTAVTPADVLAALQNKNKLPQKSVLLTFDDGYEDFYQTVYPVLRSDHLRATLFVVTGFVGEPDGRYVTWDQIKAMSDSGIVTIGAHTQTHVDLTKARDAQAQIEGSRQILESRTGQPLIAFAYPSGREDTQVVRLVQQAGFELAFTTQPGRTLLLSHQFVLPRVRISGSMNLSEFIDQLVGKTPSAGSLPHPLSSQNRTRAAPIT